VIESNDTECNEEGEVYEYQEEEDRGLANQGKPSILDAMPRSREAPATNAIMDFYAPETPSEEDPEEVVPHVSVDE
jgi:hypothetical protein